MYRFLNSPKIEKLHLNIEPTTKSTVSSRQFGTLFNSYDFYSEQNMNCFLESPKIEKIHENIEPTDGSNL